MHTEDPKERRAKRFAATATGGDDAATTTTTTAAATSTATMEARVPDLTLIADPETRRRVQMAAESDLEASRYAYWRGTVTFHDVASAWFNMSDPNLPDDLRAQFKAIYPGLLDAFAEPRKGIITAYFCRHIRVAAALTDIGHAAGASEGVPEATLKGPPPEAIREMLVEREQSPDADSNGHGDPRRRWWSWHDVHGDDHVPWYRSIRRLRLFEPAPASSSAIHIEPTFGDPADWKAKEILFHCLSLHYRALEFLTPQPRKICMRMIFSVITTLLGTLDHRQLDHERGGPDVAFGANRAEVETLERELAQAKAYYRQAAQRQAQLDYLVGMLRFLVLAGVGTAVLAIARGHLNDAATVSVLGGATGAVVSVMARMSSGGLKLTPESGRKTIRALGFMRPVLGAVFGAVIYVLLDGGIVDVINPPSGDSGKLAFYAGLGFLSGFSERFAQDVIAQVDPKKSPQPPDTAHSPTPQ